MDLLDLLAEMEEVEAGRLPLCTCVVGRSTGLDGWSLESDRDSVYFGMWVHGREDCRKPNHPHIKGIQDPYAPSTL